MKKDYKRGIAMVELIFALVIMAIALLSAPRLISQSIKSSNVALQQEAIATLTTHTGVVLSKHWDEADSNYTAGFAPIITLRNPDNSGTFPFPQNLVGINNNVSGRQNQIDGNNILTSPMGQDIGNGDFNDVDDYHNQSNNLALFSEDEASQAGELGEYIDQTITINTTVTYASEQSPNPINQQRVDIGNNIFNNQDLGGVTESNIKFITTRLTSNSGIDELNKNITLHAFSCNLGTYNVEGDQF